MVVKNMLGDKMDILEYWGRFVALGDCVLFFAHGFGWGDACDEVGWAYEYEYGCCGEADVDEEPR